MNKPISSLMETNITVIDYNDTIEKAESIMTAHEFSCLPVVDAKQGCFGVICYADIVRFHRMGKNPKIERIWESCTHHVFEIPPDTSIRETAALMLENHVHHILVTENKVLKGIVSSMDFVAEYLKQNDDRDYFSQEQGQS